MSTSKKFSILIKDSLKTEREPVVSVYIDDSESQLRNIIDRIMLKFFVSIGQSMFIYPRTKKISSESKGTFSCLICEVDLNHDTKMFHINFTYTPLREPSFKTSVLISADIVRSDVPSCVSFITKCIEEVFDCT